MSETPGQNIQADEAQTQAGGTDANAELLNRIQRLELNNAKLLDEKKATLQSNSDLQAQIQELQTNQQKAQQSPSDGHGLDMTRELGAHEKTPEKQGFDQGWQELTNTVNSTEWAVQDLNL